MPTTEILTGSREGKSGRELPPAELVRNPAPMSPASILRAAQQIERHARHAASPGGEEGKAKASGYRHALHVMHVMGGADFPSPQAVAASLAAPGTFPSMGMLATT